jgi:hypothetical protein
MDMLRRLFTGEERRSQAARALPRARNVPPDELAVERYRYLLRTAPPETIEDAHAEAFARLTPDQRRLVLQELDSTLTPAERAAGAPYDEDPRSLARLATRAELRQPGTLERTWSGMPAGLSMGGLMIGNFMSTIAGVMVGSVIADAFFGNAGYDAGSAETADASTDGFDAEGGDFGGGASGIDDGDTFGDIGSDFGGFGDFGGGDF